MNVQDAVKRMVAVADQAGVSSSANQPFLLFPEQATDRAVLLVHGFTASPWEMRPVAEHLSAAGFATLTVRLAGHGTNPEDLATRQWQEWQEDVTAGYRVLAENYRQVYAVGVSTGALLLLNSSRSDRYAGLALISPYLRLQHKLAPWAGLLRWFISHQKVFHPTASSSYYYDRRPLAGIRQLNRLLAKIESNLAKMMTPVLILGGAGDQTIDVASTRSLFEQLGTEDKAFHQFGAEAPHVLCAVDSPVQAETLERIADFFMRHDCSDIR